MTNSPFAPGSRRAPFGMTAVAVALSLGVSTAFIVYRPDFSAGTAFLNGDEAANLLVADELNAGATLYQSVAYPYGPLPIHLYALVTQAFGNDPRTYMTSMAVLSAITCGMATRLMLPFAGSVATVLIIGLGLLATMPLPGATIGGYTSSIYMPVERALLLAGVMLWQPPASRGRTPSITVGAVLGLCQAVRFGSGIVGLLSLIVIDLTSRHRLEPDAGVRRAIPAATGWLVLGFAGMELACIAYGLATVPWNFAMEWLWPLQLLDTHQLSGAPRWPTWAGWRMAATQYLMPLTAAILGLAAFVRWTRRRNPDLAEYTFEGRALALLAFYAIAAGLYFRHEHHFRQFAWMLIPAAAITVGRLPRASSVVAVAGAAAIWPLASALWRAPSSDTVRLRVPRGYVLHVPSGASARAGFLIEQVSSIGEPVLFLPNGAGWLFAFDVEHVSRHSWFYSGAVVRPFEERAFVAALQGAAAAVTCDPLNGPETLPLPQTAREAFARRFDAVSAGHGCRVFAPRDSVGAGRR